MSDKLDSKRTEFASESTLTQNEFESDDCNFSIVDEAEIHGDIGGKDELAEEHVSGKDKELKPEMGMIDGTNSVNNIDIDNNETSKMSLLYNAINNGKDVSVTSIINNNNSNDKGNDSKVGAASLSQNEHGNLVFNLKSGDNGHITQSVAATNSSDNDVLNATNGTGAVTMNHNSDVIDKGGVACSSDSNSSTCAVFETVYHFDDPSLVVIKTGVPGDYYLAVKPDNPDELDAQCEGYESRYSRWYCKLVDTSDEEQALQLQNVVTQKYLRVTNNGNEFDARGAETDKHTVFLLDVTIFSATHIVYKLKTKSLFGYSEQRYFYVRSQGYNLKLWKVQMYTKGTNSVDHEEEQKAFEDENNNDIDEEESPFAYLTQDKLLKMNENEYWNYDWRELLKDADNVRLINSCDGLAVMELKEQYPYLDENSYNKDARMTLDIIFDFISKYHRNKHGCYLKLQFFITEMIMGYGLNPHQCYDITSAMKKIQDKLIKNIPYSPLRIMFGMLGLNGNIGNDMVVKVMKQVCSAFFRSRAAYSDSPFYIDDQLKSKMKKILSKHKRFMQVYQKYDTLLKEIEELDADACKVIKLWQERLKRLRLNYTNPVVSSLNVQQMFKESMRGISIIYESKPEVASKILQLTKTMDSNNLVALWYGSKRLDKQLNKMISQAQQIQT